jgi:PleD family two-component response regulator
MLDRSGRRSSDQQNVLLIDDDRSTFGLHQKRLEARGYHVLRATGAEAALDIAKQSTPRVIFLTGDRMDVDRRRFLQALRRDDSTRHIPVHVLSMGHDGPLERQGLSRVDRESW